MSDDRHDHQEEGARRTEQARDAGAQDKGPWAATAAEGVVPAELGGADAPEEMLGDDPQLGSEVTGRTTGSDEPATRDGVDTAAGDDADATRDGGPEVPANVEPDLKDAAATQLRRGAEGDQGSR